MALLDQQLGAQQPQEQSMQQPTQQVAPQQQAIPGNDKKSVQQDAVSFSLMLRDMTPEQRQKAYPQMVKNLGDRDPEVLKVLDPNRPPTDEELDNLIPEELKGMGATPKTGTQKLSSLFGAKKKKDGGDLPNTVKAKLTNEIIDAQKDLKLIEGIYDNFDPEAFTYKGQAQEFLAEKLSKFGMASDEQKELLYNRTKQKQAIDRMMLIWRKHVTGVAGGEKEMAKIEATTLNPDQTPEQAKASLDTLYRRVLETSETNARLLSDGISPETLDKGKYSSLFKQEEAQVKREHEAYIDRFLKANPGASKADALRYRLYKARLAGK